MDVRASGRDLGQGKSFGVDGKRRSAKIVGTYRNTAPAIHIERVKFERGVRNA